MSNLNTTYIYRRGLSILVAMVRSDDDQVTLVLFVKMKSDKMVIAADIDVDSTQYVG